MPSYEEMRKIFDEVDKKFEERDKKREEERRKEVEAMGLTYINGDKPQKEHYDHPNTMENSTATIFWIASLVVGALFKGAWIIWIVSTVIWWKFITRHND